MPGFIIKTIENTIIRFNFYEDAAPVTVKAFAALLSFERSFFHARVSGQEIWTAEGLGLDIIQENASVFAEPGEMVLGPLKPLRAKTANCIGLYYGEGRGLDACNIFAKVFEEDMTLLKGLGESVWKKGTQDLMFGKFG
jgi:Protein of unknown function (DUF3830)